MTGGTQTSPAVEWGVASEPYPGYVGSGDLHVVKPFPGGLLVAVIDGLGHGGGAETAAKAAAVVIGKHAALPVTELFTRCHSELRKTRGVAMSLAVFTAGDRMTWIGVGNVDGLLLRAGADGNRGREGLVSRGGVVGYQLPPLREHCLSVGKGDTVVFATDGIKSSFSQDLRAGRPPQRVADEVLGRYGKDTDDSLVLVARYLGVSS